MIQERLVYISLGGITFALITQRWNNVIVDAAPVAKWTIGKSLSTVLKYYNNRRAIIHMCYIRYERKSS